MRRAAFVAASLIAAQPAIAAHCPHGEIYRIHLDQCVGIESALARPYVHLTRFRPPTVRHVADADQPPYPPPPPTPAPPDDQAALADPLVLPGLEDGAPAVWLLCRGAPNLCKPSDR